MRATVSVWTTRTAVRVVAPLSGGRCAPGTIHAASGWFAVVSARRASPAKPAAHPRAARAPGPGLSSGVGSTASGSSAGGASTDDGSAACSPADVGSAGRPTGVGSAGVSAGAGSAARPAGRAAVEAGSLAGSAAGSAGAGVPTGSAGGSARSTGSAEAEAALPAGFAAAEAGSAVGPAGGSAAGPVGGSAAGPVSGSVRSVGLRSAAGSSGACSGACSGVACCRGSRSFSAGSRSGSAVPSTSDTYSGVGSTRSSRPSERTTPERRRRPVFSTLGPPAAVASAALTKHSACPEYASHPWRLAGGAMSKAPCTPALRARHARRTPAACGTTRQPAPLVIAWQTWPTPTGGSSGRSVWTRPWRGPPARREAWKGGLPGKMRDEPAGHMLG
jgi:hypothetical protein